MQNTYIFQSDYLGLSDSKIHLLRNKFEYDTIAYNEVNSLVYKRGKAIKNGLILLIFALALLGAGLYITLGIISFVMSDTGGTISIEVIVASLISILLGSCFLFVFFKKEKILELKYRNNKTKKFSLSEFENRNELDALLNFLSTKVMLQREIE